MTGLKLNDGVVQLDGRVSTRATAKYLRGSASKARAVLDLIRGLDVRRADEVLQFTDRAAAAEVRKVLASAVANAVHNDSQDVEELFVVACYADEGPTLKRFRPRARGRASRINKRTCHITVIVARMSDERLEIVQARQASGPAARRVGTSAQARRERVARSRARAEGLRGGTAAAEGADATEGADARLPRALRRSTSPTTRLLKKLWKKTWMHPRTRLLTLRHSKRRPTSLLVTQKPRWTSPCRLARWWLRTTGRSPRATRSRATPIR